MGTPATKTPAQKTNAEYSKLLEKLSDIPTLPMVAMRVNELINDPYSSSGQIAEVLKKDQVLTAKVLRLVNSSYYAIPGGVTDVQRALAYLGFNTLAQLVLGLSVFSMFKTLGDESIGISMSDFWRHALGAAVASEILARKTNYPKPEEAFTCGLLHDIGKLVLHEIDPDRLRDVISSAAATQRSFFEVEREKDLPGHSFLGEVIAAKWGLPQVIRLAIRYHHFDVESMSTVLSGAKPVIHMVRLANQICVKRKVGKSGDASAGEIPSVMLERLKLSRAELEEVELELDTQMEKAGALLSAYR
jgi:putative nucleotidyltransferase with HDIG domain